MLPFKTGVLFRNFSTDRKKDFDTRKDFPSVGINFRRAGKMYFCQERPAGLKSYAKNFSEKTNTL